MARRINTKLVPRLLGRSMTGRAIYQTSRITQQSARKVGKDARARVVIWENVSYMGEREVYGLLFPEQTEIESATVWVAYDHVHSELQLSGNTSWYCQYTIRRYRQSAWLVLPVGILCTINFLMD